MASRPPAEDPRIPPVEPLPLRPPRRPWGPLPAPPTPLIGREAEAAVVGALLGRDDVRLVTLIGPGGAGKTRLALRVGEALGGRFRDGAVFVGLAQIRDPDLVLPAVARALGVWKAGGRPPADLLRDALLGRQLLLLLDNLEQVVDAAPRLAALLLAAPSLKILATSRELLRVSGEHGYPVPPLSLGEPDGPSGVATSDAVRLFVARARTLRPGFAPDAETAAVVAEVCRRVDGLPLGIELAAARVRHLSPAALLAQLERRLPLLTGGPRDQPERLRTMRGAIAWSYELLDPTEQALFRRMAVFAAGFTLEAAAAVAWEPRRPGGGAEAALDLVASLIDKSLLQAEELPGGEVRYGMLETIREYALEQLAGSGEEAAVRQRHADWCLAFAERAGMETAGSDRARWLDRQDAEMANMRAALAWLSDTERVEQALRLAGALARFWEVHGLWAEGRQWLENLLQRTTSHAGPAALRAAAIGGLGTLASRMRDFERAVECYEQSLVLSRAVGDRQGIAFALDNLGYFANERGDRNRAETLLAESLGLYRDLGDERGIAKVLDTLGLIALLHDDCQRAGALLADSLAHARAAGEPWLMAIALTNLGALANHRRDYARARGHFEESLALARASGNNWLIPFQLGYLGFVEQAQGNAERAAGLFAESLALCRGRGAQLPAPRCLEGLAAVAATRGHLERAACLFGAAQAMRTAIRGPMRRADRAIYEPIVAGLRRQLGEPAFTAAWAAGQALPVESAIDEALALAAMPAGRPSLTPTGRSAAPHGLTERETEILRLLAAGESNRGIGERLFISPATVARHVANLCGMLGVDSRAKAVAFAHRHGLG